MDRSAQRTLCGALDRLRGASVETVLSGADLPATFATSGALVLVLLVLQAAARGDDPGVWWRERCARAVPPAEALAAVSCVEWWHRRLREAQMGTKGGGGDTDGDVQALRAAIEAGGGMTGPAGPR